MHWRERMPKGVRDMEFAEYATCIEERPVFVDCSLGTNPIGSPDSVRSLIPAGLFPDPCVYPGSDLPFREALSAFWGGAFTPEEVVTETGSIGLIVSLSRTFCAPGSVVLGVTPQFPDGPMHFQFAGADYRSIPLSPPLFRLDIPSLVEAVTGEESIVYLDRPHNPTGQVPPLADIEPLAERCAVTGSLLVIDEAYGDFIPLEESGAMLTHGSVITLRSFSKGRGLAGIRAGYAVVRDPEARRFLKKVAAPFSVSSISMALASASLADSAFQERAIEAVAAVKTRVLKAISDTPGFSAAATHPKVPILLVTSHSQGEDLYERLMRQGIRTEPGSCFPGLGPQSVRLRVPAPPQLDEFLVRWAAAVD